MAEARNYRKTPGTPVNLSHRRVDKDRVRLDGREGDALVTSFVMLNAEATKLGADLTAFMAPEAPVEPPAPPPADTVAPGAPVLSGTAGDGSVSLSWTPATDNVGVTRYEVWMNNAWAVEVDPTTGTWSKTGLANGIPLTFRIVAYDAAKNYANSNTLTLIPSGTAPSSSPQFRCNTLVLEDTFDGTALDLTKWGPYDGQGHNGNGLRDPKCWSVKTGIEGATGGCLVGTAYWDASIGKMRAPAMASKLRGLATYRIEVRARCEPDPSNVTAVNQIMTWADDGVSGEFNAFESTGSNGNGSRYPMKTYDHYVLAGGQPQLYFQHDVSGAEWHTITHERASDYKRVWIDGKLAVDITDPAYLKLNSKPHHLTIQLDAMRNADPGRAVRLYVDSARIYKP
jgi:hypothetical protein